MHAYAVALIKVIDGLGTAISTSAEMTPGRLRGTARHLVGHLRSWGRWPTRSPSPERRGSEAG